MTAAQQSVERTVIPRWRAWRATEQTKELLPLRGVTESPIDPDSAARSFATHIEDFRANRGFHTACDLVNTALVLGIQDDVVVEAAQLVLDVPSTSSAAQAVARHLLNPEKVRPGPEEEVIQASRVGYVDTASKLKAIVIKEPRNAIRWVDLARVYTALGASEKASRAMRIALAVGTPNRFILRAANRFEIHRNEFGAASRILNREPRRLEDPWILAAEIATATLANTTSQNMRMARRVLEDGSREPRHLSELASAVATVEFKHGKTKSARKLMRIALTNPTDNSIAQAEWFTGMGLELGELSRTDVPPLNFEALARRADRAEAWASAVENGLLWLADQPFSFDAAAFTSFAASMGAENYPSAALAAKMGLVTNPNHPMLQNNLAYAWINMGKITEATSILQNVAMGDLEARHVGIITATKGLLLFRTDAADAGRALYREAVEIFVRLGQRDEAAMASAVQAREEIRAGASKEFTDSALQAADQHAKAAGAEAQEFLRRMTASPREG